MKKAIDVDLADAELRYMAYANKVHDALMSGMRPAPKQLPMCLHSFLSYVNYRNNCYRLNVTPFAYERYMSLIYSDMERY